MVCIKIQEPRYYEGYDFMYRLVKKLSTYEQDVTKEKLHL
jgi:hypothetical protein